MCLLQEGQQDHQQVEIDGAKIIYARRCGSRCSRTEQCVSPGAMREALSHTPMPAWQAEGLIEDYAHYGRGKAAAVISGVEDAAGTVARSFEIFAKDLRQHSRDLRPLQRAAARLQISR
jgi:hypothetical protein